MLNVYGPTEATVNTTAKALPAGRGGDHRPPARGLCRRSILDAEMKPLPPGEMGELYIGGPGVARGYLKQPELTERHFITAPLYGRLYRTGDLAARNDGRRDRIFRADRRSGENPRLSRRIVGNHLGAARTGQYRLGHGGGAEHRTICRCSPPMWSRPIPPEGWRAARCCRRCGRNCPAYMVPAYLDVLDELPMLATGKVDRKRLPAPVAAAGRRSGTFARRRPMRWKPKSPPSGRRSSTWKRSATDQDFFLDLGGHSLLAAQTVAQLRSVRCA